jgi:hypothetical protein
MSGTRTTADAVQLEVLLCTLAREDRLSSLGLPDTLVDAARSLVPHSGGAAVLLADKQHPLRVIACTDEVLRTALDVQFDLGDGPVQAAVDGLDPVLVADLAVERRWPKVVHRLLDLTPVRSLLAVGLPRSNGSRGALVCWAESDRLTTGDATALAALAGVAASSMDTTAAVDRCHHLEIALQTNRRIGMAIGILMASRLVTEEAAFEMLRAVSSAQHRKIADVAGDVVDTGTLPTLGSTAAGPPAQLHRSA